MAATPIGYYINELIDDMEITQKEFATRLGTTEKVINELINGKTKISKDIAIKLSNATGTSAELWLNLQNEYERN
jgi:addiction module HigA family antidote